MANQLDFALQSTMPTKKSSQIGTIVTLYLILRLTILFFYTPQGLFNAYTDYNYYYRTARLSEQGYFPFINMWYEYPPVLAYLPQVAYWLTGMILPMGDTDSFSYLVYIRILGMILLIFEAGVLLLLHAIGEKLWGLEKADWLAWVYSGLSLPLFFWNYAHQVVAVFFTLLAIYLFLQERFYGSAVALGLGVVSKFIPVFLLAPVVRFLWPHRRRLAMYFILVALVVALAYLPFVILGGAPWIAASFAAVGRVGSYGTIWAILDGNWGPGTYGDLSSRLSLIEAYQVHANPPVIPGIILLIIFAVIFSLFFFRPLRDASGQEFIWFTILTVLIFHLWSRGWSPQWATMMIPLLLLAFPNNIGLNWTLMLTGLVFIEWPFTVTFNSKILYSIFILLRTALFITVAFQAVQILWPKPSDKILSNV